MTCEITKNLNPAIRFYLPLILRLSKDAATILTIHGSTSSPRTVKKLPYFSWLNCYQYSKFMRRFNITCTSHYKRKGYWEELYLGVIRLSNG